MNRRLFLVGLLSAVALAALAHDGQTVLYEKDSAYNTIVVTDEGNGLRALRFGRDGVRQSVVKPGNPDYLALPYDAIFLDAFGANSVPPHLATQEFLQAVRRAVAPHGVVIGNLWGRMANPLYDSMVRTYQEVFDELLILDVRGAENKILLALPRKQPVNRDELAQMARKASSARQFLFDLSDPVKYGFQDAPAMSRRERILRDRDIESRRHDSFPRKK